MNNPVSSTLLADVVALWPADLDRQSPPQHDWLWHGYLASSNVTLLTSQWKAGKTTLLAILLRHLKQGGMLAGLPLRAGRALVVSEESATLWQKRSQKLGFTDQVCLVCRPFAGKPSREQWQALLDRLVALHQQFRFDLAVFDTLASFLPAGSENQADAMLHALAPLQLLTKEGLSVLGLHHPGKKKVAGGMAARGSGALSGHVDILVEMRWYDNADKDDRRRRLLAWSRHEETPRQLVIELNVEGTDYRCLEEKEPEDAELIGMRGALGQVLERARIKLTQKQIREQWPAGDPKPSVAYLSKLLVKAVESGEVKRQGQGTRTDAYRYWLPSLEEKWQKDPTARLEQTMLDSRLEVMQRLPDLFTPEEFE
jgi:hypothetical protein